MTTASPYLRDRLMRRPEFTAWFNRVTAGDSQYTIAEKIGTSQAYVNQLKRGIARASRDLIEHTASAYGADAREGLIAAG